MTLIGALVVLGCVTACRAAEKLPEGGMRVALFRPDDRSYHCSYRRAISFSKDGGLTWSAVTLDKKLFEPICSGSIARLPSVRARQKKDRIIFANSNGRVRSGHVFVREKLTVRLSYDEGKSWPVDRVQDPGPAGNLNAIGLPDGRVGVLYEGGARQNFRETIYFSTCTVNWLTRGRDRGESLKDTRKRHP